PLTRPGVYSKDVGGNAARYPVADLIAPLWVVSASAQSNGVGGTNGVSYQYGGLKFEQAQGPGFGRGLLGFRWVRSTEVASGIQTYTEYRQNWPYTGQAVVTQTQLPGYGNGSLLQRTIYNHSCYRTNTSGATASCGEQASGKVIFPFVARSTEESWDLNGATLPTISTATGYGGTAAANGQTLQLGDATTVEVDITYGGALKSRKRTINQYHPAQTSGNSWILGRLARAAVTSFSADSPPHANNITRTSSFAYDAQGLLIKEVIEPDTPSICQQTTYTYDAYGNRNRVAANPCPGANGWVIASAGERASTSRFDLQIVHIDGTSYTTGAGIFASTSTNALGHSETRRHDPRHGGVVALTGPNHLTTTWTYDAFGRKTSETRADGTSSRWSFHLCAPEGQSRDPRCPMDIGGAPVDWYALEEHLGASGLPMAAPKLQFYDQLGRIVRIQTQGFDGQGPGDVLVQESHYNHLGQRVRQSILYRLGDSPVWTTYTYDRLGRVATQSVPDSAGTATTEFIYNGLETAVINAGGQRQTKFSNANGQVERIVNHFGYRTLYFYDALGQLIRTDAYGSITELTYDLRGRKIRMQDPAMGSWDYAYNAFDELVWQADGLSQITTMQYDTLGRLIRREEPDLISQWFYDKDSNGHSCGNAIGKLCEATANNGYRRVHGYDPYGRPVYTLTALDNNDQMAHVGQNYDLETGRLSMKIWPTGYMAYYSYTPLGYLKRIDGQSPDGAADAAASLEILAMDPQGRVSSYRQGAHITTVKTHDAVTGNLRTIQSTTAGQASGNLHNQNFVYDKLGNLLIRQDSNLGLIENFTYDGLNRLIYTTAQGGGLTSAQSVQLIYDGRGNIQYKSDVGYYHYDPARPNRLAQITLTQPSSWQGSSSVAVANTGTRALAYAFDDARTGAKTNSAGQRVGNGNLWYTVSQDAASGKHTVRWETYTSFNQPKEILFGNLISPENPTATTADRRLTFLYGPEHQRIKQKLEFTSNAPSHMQEGSIYYLNGTDGQALTYEKEIKTSGLIEHRHFLSAAGITFALYTQREGHLGGQSAREVNYWHHDHLGSLAAISSPSGALIERLAFDAWGKRRHLSGAADSQDALYGQSTSRGYTLHEHLDEVGVIHMNGRIYDPLIGRFMSADPIIQAPENLQNHNRYAYVLNNPLAYTDPSGYKFSLKGFFKATLKAAFIPTAKNTFNFIASQPGQQYVDNYIMTHQWAYTVGQGAASIFTAFCGGCGGALWASYYTYQSTGSMNAAARAGATSYAVSMVSMVGGYYAGNIGQSFGEYGLAHFAAHAVVGCAASEIGGGSCRTGALSGMAGLAGTPFGFVGAVVAGGTASVIGGGKFANGAVTAAFGYVFNHCAHEGCSYADFRESVLSGMEQIDSSGCIHGSGAVVCVGPGAIRGVGARLVRALSVRGALMSNPAKQAEAAAKLGFDQIIKNPNFNSMGQRVFSNGKHQISFDVTGHKGGVWKVFNKAGERVGTYDETLTIKLGK
ncbi:MAG TPA: RHS repeat-associated core domain-containing protein, partial [Burkholderiaceae bacterium]|nr:RHS repeat-associated core domain-containing protein [Burkholderiaceae bacterium]